MKLEKMKPGMILYDRHTYRMGNTTIRALGEWPVEVLEVHEDHIVARWNGNPPKKIYRSEADRRRSEEVKVLKANGNVCEHGDHPAPAGKRYCSEACADCDTTYAPAGEDCANICGLRGEAMNPRKPKVAGSVRVKAYDVFERAVDEGIAAGWARAHKHVDDPSPDDIKAAIYTAVTNAVAEYFDFGPQGEES